MALCTSRVQRTLAVLCALTLSVHLSYSWQQNPSLPAQNQPSNTFPPEQLDSLVAPIALFPDQLLSQVLVASTYPLEVVEADRWLKQNSSLKGKDLAAAATKQSWDASVQALVAFPDVLKQLDSNINWVTELGNAFLAQQPDVMDAVQRMRQKAQQSGALQSTDQQSVSTTSENNNTYIEIQPTDPEVVYVPQYDSSAIWGASAYPYPPSWYPGAVASGVLSFGAGIAISSIWGGGGWGWNCGWGSHNVLVNNNFINNNHFNRVNAGNNNIWQHNAMHRQGVPYSNRTVANRFNGGGLNPANRPTLSQTQQRLGQASREAGFGTLGQRTEGPGQLGQRNLGSASRSIGSEGARFGGSDRLGNREIGGSDFGGAGRGAFGDINRGGSRAQMNMNRGFGSAGGFRGGGGFQGGGGFHGGGGFRGGGGRRR